MKVARRMARDCRTSGDESIGVRAPTSLPCGAVCVSGPPLLWLYDCYAFSLSLPFAPLSRSMRRSPRLAMAFVTNVFFAAMDDEGMNMSASTRGTCWCSDQSLGLISNNPALALRSRRYRSFASVSPELRFGDRTIAQSRVRCQQKIACSVRTARMNDTVWGDGTHSRCSISRANGVNDSQRSDRQRIVFSIQLFTK